MRATVTIVKDVLDELVRATGAKTKSAAYQSPAAKQPPCGRLPMAIPYFEVLEPYI